MQGLGECWCFDTAPDALVAFLRTELAPNILGCQLVDYPSIYDQLIGRATLTARHGMLASALSGVDIAVWDMRSRIVEKPLWSFIRSFSNVEQVTDGHVKLYGSGGLYGESKTLNDLADEMHDMSQSGFGIVKMKVGGLSLSEDIERVKTVLAKLNDSCKLIIAVSYTHLTLPTILLV